MISDSEFQAECEAADRLILADPKTVAAEGVDNFLDYCEMALVRLANCGIRKGAGTRMVNLHMKVSDIQKFPEKYTASGAGPAKAQAEPQMVTPPLPIAPKPKPEAGSAEAKAPASAPPPPKQAKARVIEPEKDPDDEAW